MTGPVGGRATIVGGGLVGALLSIFLVRRGLRVTVHESRPDPRQDAAEGGRSINLVVAARGIAALERVGLAERVLRLTVPVTGRMMHSVEGRLTYQPYGRDENECNYSISRGDLNRFLIDEAEEAGVAFRFGERLVGADPERGRLEFRPPSDEAPGDVVFGADGAGSALREAMAAAGHIGVAVEPLGHGYKELTIPPGAGGSFRMARNALHIWPRNELMLMALPNLDGSFTVTLYLPDEGPASFAALDRSEVVRRFFEEHFPDALPLVPRLEREFFDNPTGFLGTVRARRWHVAGRWALIGDAAHAIVPFFGQGMNCGFEDCTVLDRLLDAHADEGWAGVLARFERERKPDADAIADMALDNFVEMRDRVGDPAFLLRKAVEHRLERELGGAYRSRYALVMYTGIRYRTAQRVGRVQDEMLAELCAGIRSADELDLDRAARMVRERLAPLLGAAP